MSGGFFRGTSADQDTRFSNKQAKLLKTQKFAPELEHLVDMTKVKMDVMKPWIATRVTELLGFEDEVLINFIYGLLEQKEADGKKIQIQLTGFMEKNTVKFMKELWSLLLSAQQNASGVPQQFLDAKEAEIQQKKAEESRIAQEIQKKREKDGREQELEKQKLMDGDAGNSRLGPDHADAEEEKELYSKHSSRTRSWENRRSKSISLSPRSRQRSISPRRRSPSPRRSRRSISPRRSFSPQRRSPRSTPSMSRRRSPHSKRSPSVPRHRSPSPHRRSRIWRKSPPFGRRRTPSPHHHRSLGRAPRSPSPARRRSPRRRSSPDRHWSPSPGRRRPRSPSPERRRPRSPSPGRRRPRSPSPGRRRPRSPSGRRSPWSPSLGRRRPWSRSPGRQRSPSHHSPRLRSPKRPRRSPISPRSHSANCQASPQRRRRTSPHNRSPIQSRRSLSRDIEKGTNGVPSRNNVDVLQRNKERSHDDNRNDTEVSGHFSSDSEHCKLKKSLSSPNKPERNSTRDSSLKSTDKHLPSQDGTDSSGEEEGSHARENARKANSSRRKIKDFSADLKLKKAHDDLSPGEKSPSRSQHSGKETRRKQNNKLSESSEHEHDGRRMKHTVDSPDDSQQKQHSPSRVGMHNSYSKDGMNNKDATKGLHDGMASKKCPAKVDEDSESEDGSSFRKDKRKAHGNSHIDYGSSGSEESGKHKSHSDKRKHKRSRKHKRHYDDSSDESNLESDDKESKRRRKEEKRLRKEERRRKREERHHRREDRQASKLKRKHAETVDMASDLEKDCESDSDADVQKKGSYTGREELDQQKLELELREKALESLRAKKAINH